MSKPVLTKRLSDKTSADQCCVPTQTKPCLTNIPLTLETLGQDILCKENLNSAECQLERFCKCTQSLAPGDRCSPFHFVISPPYFNALYSEHISLIDFYYFDKIPQNRDKRAFLFPLERTTLQELPPWRPMQCHCRLRALYSR